MKRKWWHDKVAYQIYPKSFYDSNGDGIGDIPGIIEKLDYLKDLGVDIVWLSPVYRSPLADQGYDISDYYNIDPRFGTMEDMDRLLAEAQKRDMYIVMDLVVNHCSDEHEWFQKACADPEGEYGQYFYLKRLRKKEPAEISAANLSSEDPPGYPGDPANPVPAKQASADQVPADPVPAKQASADQVPADPAPAKQASADSVPVDPVSDYSVCSPDGYVLPCNWRSYFGGPVWEKLPGHEDWFYLHVFHKKQPDLNWENPKVREKIYTMINWWLDKGLAGFRIDAIINIKKALPFRNYAPDRADGLCTINRMLQDASGVGDFLGEMRDRTFAPHRAFTVGEVFNEKPEELPFFIGDNGYFSSMFDFSETVWGNSPAGWHENKGITPDDYKNCLYTTQKKVGEIGFISNIIENHDEPRGVSRYIPPRDMQTMPEEMRIAAKKALATVYFFVKGLPWIYQGQEIGMENVSLQSIEEVDDISSLDAWNVMRRQGVSDADALRAIERNGRDNARTPFQWSGHPGAGFTTGTPWLRINPDYTAVNLKQQTADPASVFHYYKKLIALRKDPRYRETLVFGSFEPYLEDVPNVIAYLRRPVPFREGEQPQEEKPPYEEILHQEGRLPQETKKGETENSTAAEAIPVMKDSAAAEAILVISNYQKETRTLPLPAPVKNILLDNCGHTDEPLQITDSGITLPGYRTLVLELCTE